MASLTVVDRGDTINLTAPTATDGTGAAANSQTVTLTVTLPDGSTTTPIVTNPPAVTGVYAYPFATTQAGLHHYRYTGTGGAATAWAYNDVFNVGGDLPDVILSLPDAREALRKTAAATADDEELRLYMAAVTTIVEDVVGPQAKTTQTLTVSGGHGSILLPVTPASVTSITENGWTLTEGTDFVVDYLTGVVRRGTLRQPYVFIAGTDNIVITYTTGTGVVPENVRLAARIILKHLWTADNTGTGRPGLNTAQASSADVVITPSGYAIPRRAAELLAPSDTGMPGFA